MRQFIPPADAPNRGPLSKWHTGRGVTITSGVRLRPPLGILPLTGLLPTFGIQLTIPLGNMPLIGLLPTLSVENQAPTVSLANAVAEIDDDQDVTSAVFMADIVVNDDGVGVNTLALTGADAAQFQIVGTKLYLKAGATVPTGPATMTCTVTVDDPEVVGSPDDTVVFTLTVNASGVAMPLVAFWDADDSVGDPLTLLANSVISGSANYDLDTVNSGVYGNGPDVSTVDPPAGMTKILIFDGVNDGIWANIGASATEVSQSTDGTIFFYFETPSDFNATGSEQTLLNMQRNTIVQLDSCSVRFTTAGLMRLWLYNAANQHHYWEKTGALSVSTRYRVGFRQNGTTLQCWIDGVEVALTRTNAWTANPGAGAWWDDLSTDLGADFCDQICVGGRRANPVWGLDWKGELYRMGIGIDGTVIDADMAAITAGTEWL